MLRKQSTENMASATQVTRMAQFGTRSGRGFQRLVVFVMVALFGFMTLGAPANAVEKKKKSKAKTSVTQKKRAKKSKAKSKTTRKTTRKATRKTTRKTTKRAVAPTRRYNNFIDKDRNGIDDRTQRRVNKLTKPSKRTTKAKATAKKSTKKSSSKAKKSSSKKSTKKKKKDK
ncbi:hypothetical protein JYU19_00290 [bacterium AH-315-J21]|nr:hypothetical protein [bacterium AH-315-J21]